MYYGIGLGIGLLFVSILFGTRGCNWLPQNRIKASIFSQIIALDTTEIEGSMNPKQYVDLLNAGKVDFSLSMRKGEPKAYYFSNTKTLSDAHFLQVIFETDGVVALLKPIAENQKTKAHINDMWLPIVHMPSDSSFIGFSQDVINDVRYYNLNRQDIFDALKSNGVVQTIPYDTDPEKRKIHVFLFESNERKFRIRARIFQHTLELLFLKEEL
jgi:hypothetical protein